MTVKLQRAPGHLDAIVGEAVAQASGKLAAKNLAMEPQIGGPIPAYPMDEDLIREAVIRLLEAAIETAAPEAKMRVTVKANRSALMVAIKSPGVGLARADRDRLFEGDESSDTLARARSIISAHGGRVWANGREGRGLTYYLTLDGRQGAGQDA